MEQALVFETKNFALRLYHLLRDLDPARWGLTRKQALKSRILQLETEVNGLYAKMQDLSDELTEAPVAYPASAWRLNLQQVGSLLNELHALHSDRQMSYLALYGLRKRLQRAYHQLSLMMEAYAAPIPHIRPSNVARSLFHVGSAMGILAMIENVPHFGYMFWIALAYFAFCWSCETLKRVSPAIKARIMRFFALIAHPHEYDKVNSATWYGTALLLLSLTNPVIGTVAVTVLGVADPAAAAIGRKFGRTRLPGNRSLEGSLGFWVTGTLATTLMLSLLHPLGSFGNNLLVATVASLCGALGELAGAYPDDNLTVPAASAAGAALALLMLGLPLV